MSAHSTTDPVTTSVTKGITYGPFSPFLPTIGRVHMVLCQMAPAGHVIETNNRTIAQAAQCSPSAIPEILRDLEALDYISRVTGSRGSLIEVLDRSGMLDRSASPSGVDHEFDRRTEHLASDHEWGMSNRSNTPDRSRMAETDRSPMSDPPPHPPYMVINSKAATAAAAAFDSVPSGGSGGMSAADRWPDRADIATRLDELDCEFTDEIMAARPQLTLAKLEEQWTIAQQREQDGGVERTARDLLFGVLRKPNGGWLHGRAPRPAVDWSVYQQRQQTAAEALPSLDSAANGFEAAQARARQLVPDATVAELEIMAADLQEGRSADDVRDWLYSERRRRELLSARASTRRSAYA